jgi:hypothetical protein
VYYLAGQSDVASALLATVMLSMLVQNVGVIFNHRHRGLGPLALEILVVLSGFKPLVDTRRVLNKHKIVGAPVDVMFERTGCKMAELVLEAVPSVIIVIRSTLAFGVTSYVPLFSIGMSLLSIATISTGTFFGFDQDPDGRLHSPMFYGCIRKEPLQQVLTRVSLYMFSLAHPTLKLCSIAMLLLLSKTALAVYLTGTIGLYLMYKQLRGDMYYWVPNSGIKVALLMRSLNFLFVRTASALLNRSI